VVHDAIAPTATGMTSGAQVFFGYTGANHAAGPFLFRNLVGAVMYSQGTTPY